MEGKVYAQVYSVIRAFSDRLISALKLFSATGYDGIELVGDNTEGLEQEEFSKFLKELNLDVISVHSIRGEANLYFAQKVGAKYNSLHRCCYRFLKIGMVL